MFERNKVRFKLVSYILIILSLAIICVAYFTFKVSEQEVLKEKQDKLLVINESKAKNILFQLNEVYRSIENIKKLSRDIYNFKEYKVAENKRADLQKIHSLQEFMEGQFTTLKTEHNFHNIAVVEINGLPILNTKGFRGLPSSIIDNGQLYKQALTDVVFSRAYEINGRNCLAILSPIKYQSKSEGVSKVFKKTIALLIIEINIDPLHEILNDETGLEYEGESIVLTSSGKGFSFITPPRNNSGLFTQTIAASDMPSEAVISCFKDKQSGFKAYTEDYNKQEVFAAWKYMPELDWGVITYVPVSVSNKKIEELRYLGILLSSLVLFLTWIFVVLLVSRYTKPIREIKSYLVDFAKGNTEIKIHKHDYEYEIKEIIEAVQILCIKQEEYKMVTQNIISGNLNVSFSPTLQHDVLAENLKLVQEVLKHINKENTQRKWVSEGMSLHAEIMMENSGSLQDLGNKLISSIVNYLNAHQGAVFSLKKKEDDRYSEQEDKNISVFELIATYAVSPSRFRKHTVFKLGQGLVGQCAQNKKTMYLENTPLVQSNIESGLGQAPASNLLIVPLKINEEVLGILELSSFNKFKSYEIEFLENLGESVASTLLNLIANERFRNMLKENQLALSVLQQKEKENTENQSNMVDLLESLQMEYKTALQEIHKLKKENQELRNDLNGK